MLQLDIKCAVPVCKDDSTLQCSEVAMEGAILPVNLNMLLSDTQITPPLFAELPVKLLVPLKVATTIADVPIAPPTESFAELLKLLVPLKAIVTLATTDIAPPLNPAELFIKSLSNEYQ